MVGLFWITEDSVYLGAEPAGTASGVRLTEEGVETLGAGREAFWSWPEVERIDVRDVPVRSAPRRLVSMALGTLYSAVTGDGEHPPAWTVRVETADGAAEVEVHAAVAGGTYTPAEYVLSRTVLGRLASGGTTVGDLVAWRLDRPTGDSPPRGAREALLRTWAGPQDMS
ncbi:hypothetical protein [Streptomyces marincola]|nr:hypothetical protein [Streptomyces marincola]